MGGNARRHWQRTLLDMMIALDLEFVIRPRTKVSPSDIEEIF